MDQGAIQLLADPELLAARQAWEQRLRSLSDAPVYLQGVARTGKTDMYEDAGGRAAEAIDDLAHHARHLADTEVFRPLSVSSALHGVHFVDKILGANVFELDGEKGNWQASYLAGPVGSLEQPDLEANTTWAAARRFARAFIECGVTAAVLQLPTVASALNIGLNLYGQELLVAMLAGPAAAHHDLGLINGVLLDIHDWYRANVPPDLLHQVACSGRYQPPGSGQICGCSTQLISGDQYRRFVADLDDAVLSRYPNGA